MPAGKKGGGRWEAASTSTTSRAAAAGAVCPPASGVGAWPAGPRLSQQRDGWAAAATQRQTPFLGPHLQFELYPLEHVHVVHPQQHRLALELSRQLALPPYRVVPGEAAEQALWVHTCGAAGEGRQGQEDIEGRPGLQADCQQTPTFPNPLRHPKTRSAHWRTPLPQPPLTHQPPTQTQTHMPPTPTHLRPPSHPATQEQTRRPRHAHSPPTCGHDFDAHVAAVVLDYDGAAARLVLQAQHA
jgi:hypothetical protein